MNIDLASAAGLALIAGLVHSILGEILIFSTLRKGQIAPTDGGSLLQRRKVRILLASTHVRTWVGIGA